MTTELFTESDPEDDLARLTEEAARYSIGAGDYVGMTKRERGLIKARWAHKLKAEARRHGINPVEYLGMTAEQRVEAREQALREIGVKESGGDDDERVKVFTARDDVPQTEHDPLQRDGITIGEIRERPPDLASDDLRTIRDLYNRFTIGDGQFLIRVERIQPKVWQGVPCAGYLGEIREKISEAQFQRYFGGREYELQVHGPDPRGTHDPLTGLPVIKALTDPIKVTVPLLPPNLQVLPATKPEPDEEHMTQSSQPWNPYASGAPATTADATIHRTTSEFAWKAMEQAHREKEEALRRADTNGGNSSNKLIEMMQRQHENSMELLKREQENKQKAYEDRLKEERERATAFREELDAIKAKQEGNGGQGHAIVEAIKATQPTRNASDDVARVSETFRDQINRMKESHSESIEATKTRQEEELRRTEERHKAEVGRANDRYADMEAHYKKMLDDERQKRLDRERELKDEIDRRVREERETAETRVRETKERFEDRIKDNEKAHQRELGSIRENFETRMATKEATLSMEISNLKDKFDEAKSELAEARDEAQKNSDPVEVMEKQERVAKALGYRKKDEEAQKGWDLVAATAGAGIGQAFSTIGDWLPKAVEGMRKPAAAQPGQPGQPNLRVLQGGQSPQNPAQGARRKAIAWATEGSIPTAAPPPSMPAEPVAPTAPPPAAEAPQQQPAPAQPVQQPAAPAQPAAQTNALNKIFTDEAIESFRVNVEQAVNSSVPAPLFAQQFAARYPQPTKDLIALYKASDFIDYVKGKGNPLSPVLRRDGKGWVDQLWATLGEIHAKAQA